MGASGLLGSVTSRINALLRSTVGLRAATISSRAYVDAVNRAYMAYKSVAGGEFAAEKVADEARKGGNNE